MWERERLGERKIFAWRTRRGDHYEFRMFTVSEMREFLKCTMRETRARPSP